jgi:hypothetical protein
MPRGGIDAKLLNRLKENTAQEDRVRSRSYTALADKHVSATGTTENGRNVQEIRKAVQICAPRSDLHREEAA